MKSLIIGTGEIGRGLYECLQPYHEIYTYDIMDDREAGHSTFPIDGGYEILHICIPGNIKSFNKTVCGYINRLKPMLTIIHSTVPVGTTRAIAEESGAHVVHSPVRGIHPHMAKGIKTYVKYVGYLTIAARLVVNMYFEPTEIKIKTLFKPETTELAKILSTTRYGLNLMFARMTSQLCDDLGLNGREVYQEWEHTYNAGLKELGMDKYIRPVLSFPGEKIGGHCVIENAYMLLDQLDDLEFDNENVELIRTLYDIVSTGQGDRNLEGIE